MTIEKEYSYIVLGMGFVTFLPRLLPIYVLAGRTLPRWLIAWLDVIPSAVLSALLLPALVTTGIPRTFSMYSLEMIAAVPTFLVAIKTKSLVVTVVTGMGIYWFLKTLL